MMMKGSGVGGINQRRNRKAEPRRQQQNKKISDVDNKSQSSGQQQRSQHGETAHAHSPGSQRSESSSDPDFDGTVSPTAMAVNSVQRRIRLGDRDRFAVLKREQAEDRLEKETDFVLYYEWPSDDVVCHSVLRLMIAYRTSFNENRFYRVESFKGYYQMSADDHAYHVISADGKITVSRPFSSIKALVKYHENFGHVWRHPTTGEGLVDVFPGWSDNGHSEAEEATELSRALRRQQHRVNCSMHSQRNTKPQR